MTSQALNKLGYLAVFVLIFTFWGCASDPVQAELPANHPANPEAAEAAYTAAPNPFQDKMSMNAMESTDAPSMSPRGHEDSLPHKMSQGMIKAKRAMKNQLIPKLKNPIVSIRSTINDPFRSNFYN